MAANILCKSAAPEFVDSSFMRPEVPEYYLSPDKLSADHSPAIPTRSHCFVRYVLGGAFWTSGAGRGFSRQPVVGIRTPIPSRATMAGPALEHARGLGIEVHRGSLTRLRTRAEPLMRLPCGPCWSMFPIRGNGGDRLMPAEARGRFALVPNLDSLAVRLFAGKYRYILPQHVNYFSGATLRRLLSDAGGLVEVGIRGTHFNPLVIAQDFRRSGRLVPDADRARLLQRTNAYKQSALLRPMHWLYRGWNGASPGSDGRTISWRSAGNRESNLRDPVCFNAGANRSVLDPAGVVAGVQGVAGECRTCLNSVELIIHAVPRSGSMVVPLATW